MEDSRDGERELRAGYGGLVSTLVHAGKETWVWRLWPRRPWATWWTCAIGQVARLALGGVHRALPQPERKPVSTASRSLAAPVAVPGGEAHLCRSVSWGTGLGPRAWGGGAAPCCTGPGTPVHQAGPSAHGQARVWSEAGEGPELWRSPPPSPVGTALTLAGLGHEERRGRGRGGRPQTSVEREPNCKIQRQEPPDCRWGPGGLRAPRPCLPGLWGKPSAGQDRCSGLLQEGVTAAARAAQKAGATDLQGCTPLAPEALGMWDNGL